MNIMDIDLDLNQADQLVALMTGGELVFTYNQLNRHLLDVSKPQKKQNDQKVTICSK